MALQRGDAGDAFFAPGRGGSGLGRITQSGFGKVGGVGKAGGVTTDNADARAPLVPGDELLDLGVVESRRRHPSILHEDLGEITTAAKGGLECSLKNCLFDQLTSLGVVYRRRVPLHPGLSAAVELVVAEDDTALALKTGDVPVLATPRVVTLAEEATVLAVEEQLANGTTSVGYRVQLDHLAPTAVGGKVRAEATLESIEGRRLTFRVSVSDGHGLVAAGRITRVIVERARFLEKATGE